MCLPLLEKPRTSPSSAFALRWIIKSRSSENHNDVSSRLDHCAYRLYLDFPVGFVYLSHLMSSFCEQLKVRPAIAHVRKVTCQRRPSMYTRICYEANVSRMVPEAQPPGAKDCVHGDSRFVSLPSLRPAFVPLTTGSRLGYDDDLQVCES